MLRALGLTVFVLVLSVGELWALPFNDDMVHDQYPTGEVMRAAPAGSVPLGASERFVGSRSDAEKLTNPSKRDKNSVARGERVWNVNCVACHGVFNGKKFEYPVPEKAWSMGIKGPDLTLDMYKKDRTDGSIFATIHFGSLSTLMPRYGWKLSMQDHWDLVSYIRDVQKR